MNKFAKLASEQPSYPGAMDFVKSAAKHMDSFVREEGMENAFIGDSMANFLANMMLMSDELGIEFQNVYSEALILKESSQID